MMIQGYTFGVSIGEPVQVFQAPAEMPLKALLERLGLEKGTGGATLTLATPQARRGTDRFPSDLLLRRLDADTFAVVGALATRYDKCQDFALTLEDPELLEKAKKFATAIQFVVPDEDLGPRTMETYMHGAIERYDR